jgi:hypothetical protein
VPNAPIKHGRGLRQSDPLSPLLFVIAIDPLQKILELATKEQHLTKFRGKQSVMQTSVYADDTAIFVKPYKKDVTALANILAKFGEVSGLKTNFQKSSVIPIRCQGVDLRSCVISLQGVCTSQLNTWVYLYQAPNCEGLTFNLFLMKL